MMSQRRDIMDEEGLFCDVTKIDLYSETLKRAIDMDFGDKPSLQARKFSWEICAGSYFDAVW